MELTAISPGEMVCNFTGQAISQDLVFSTRYKYAGQTLSPIFSLLIPASCLLSPIFSLLIPVSCLLSPVFCLLSSVSYFLSSNSCLLSSVFCLLFSLF